MEILTVAGAKGGTGKTTTATNVAAELAVAGASVAVLDLDPQASATLALGGEPARDPFTADATPVGLDGAAGRLHVYPGGRAMAMAAGDDVERRVRGISGYDVLVIDTPPALGPLVTTALLHASLVLVPIEATPLALPALGDIMELMEELGAPTNRLRGVLVRVDRRRVLTTDVRELLAEEHPRAIYETEIPEDVRAAEAPGFGIPLRAHAPTCRAAQAYEALARSVGRELGVIG